MVVLCAVATMIALFFVIDTFDWPLYIGLALAFILPIGIMMVCFNVVAKAWIRWAYLRVTDVKELEQASQLSGFGGYSPFDLKDEEKGDLIKARFNDYQFIDDPSVPSKTEVYYEKLYRNFTFMVIAGLTIVFVALVATGYATRVAIVLPIVSAAGCFVIYYKSSDRSPQITLSDTGIETDGTLYEWKDISRWEVRQGRTSDLSFICAGTAKSIELNNLAAGNRRLNHLLHVYSQRGKSGSAERGVVHRPGVLGYRPQG